MSAVEWTDWSCTVRVVVDDGRGADETTTSGTTVARQVVQSLMDDVSLAASRFRHDSDLARINAGAGRLVPVGALTLLLVDEALAAARRTDGACDPTLGHRLIALGYDDDIDAVRSRTTVAGTGGWRDTAASGWASVRVDRDLRLVGVPAGTALDLGATAKAWTADEAARTVARTLSLPALVSVGGDVAVSRDPGGVWPVLVTEHEADAHRADAPGQVITLTAGGLATSSTRGRTWRTADGEQHHVVDPATGRPTAGRFRTASVVAPTCVEANALSTAALVWGAGALDRLAEHPARLVTADGDVVTTSRWPAPAGVLS